MNKRFIIAGLLIVVMAIASAYKLYNRQEQALTATGTIEITHVDVAPKLAGFLQGLSLREGDKIKAGQVVAKIDRQDLVLQVARDEAALERTIIQLRDLESGSRRQERDEALANVSSAQAVYTKAKADFERLAELYGKGAIAEQQLDAARAALTVAQSALEAVKARQSTVQEGVRPETIEAQRAEIVRSKAVAELSKTVLADAVVSSPLEGVVLKKNLEDGEFVNAGVPIVTIGNLTDCWVKVYIASNQLGLIALNQPVDVRVDSFPSKNFAGQVTEISQNAEFTPRQSLTKNERANLVFAVKVKVSNPDGILKPGMPADVVFR